MSLENFQKAKDFLICVDSDGCAMDTMNIKHTTALGPCMVEEWDLEEWKEPILERWNEINLFSMTRGINRFKGLAKALAEVDQTYTPIEDIKSLQKWIKESDELSNSSLQRTIDKTDSICLKKALNWSITANKRISSLSFDVKEPFPGAKEGIAYAHQYADIAVVSSANLEAVEEEWKYYGLAEHVNTILAQDAGSKAFCIGSLLKKGYDPANVLMLGDAPGDYDAAKKNGVFYYPILVNHEQESWKEFRETAVGKLIDHTYIGNYQDEKVTAFLKNLGA